jgi:Protein of unknown function (DUF3043)
MLGRRTAVTDDPEVSVTTYADQVDAAQAGKGRPTPKRAESRKARRNALPKDRKEAAAVKRERARADRRLARTALMTGDEANLPPRDAGPERKLARDVVDTRFAAGGVLFAVIFLGFVLTVVQSRAVKLGSDFGGLIALAILAGYAMRCGRKAKVAVRERFNADAKDLRGISSYAFMRALLPRRFRRPPPKISRGEPVR